MTTKVRLDELLVFFQLQGTVTHHPAESPGDYGTIKITTNNYELAICYVDYPLEISITQLRIHNKRTDDERLVYGDTLSFLELQDLQ